MKLLINNKEITNISGLEWSDDIENIADTVSFQSDIQIEAGSQFTLFDDKSIVMTGIISEYSQQKKDTFSYSGYDFGFYLNHNSIIKQFNGLKISEAMQTLCREYKIPVGNIPTLNATIKKIYKNTTLSDCFNEMLELAQTKIGKDYYYMTCADGKFNVKKYQLIENLNGITAGLFTTLSNNTIHSPNISVSMEDMKNQVVVIDSASDKITKKHTVRDNKNISKFGLLQHIEEPDKDNKNNFSKIAQNKLTELNQLKTTISLSMLGNHKMRKGVIVPIQNKEFDLNGDFLITSSKHSISGAKETVTVNLLKYPRARLA